MGKQDAGAGEFLHIFFWLAHVLRGGTTTHSAPVCSSISSRSHPPTGHRVESMFLLLVLAAVKCTPTYSECQHGIRCCFVLRMCRRRCETREMSAGCCVYWQIYILCSHRCLHRRVKEYASAQIIRIRLASRDAATLPSHTGGGCRVAYSQHAKTTIKHGSFFLGHSMCLVSACLFCASTANLLPPAANERGDDSCACSHVRRHAPYFWTGWCLAKVVSIGRYANVRETRRSGPCMREARTLNEAQFWVMSGGPAAATAAARSPKQGRKQTFAQAWL
ncbi:hypothetical protein GQ54DRAFT_51133 [Martensiomyces pterosporus]|nr:hypothetical protein GQ54DRAFT_51133 [Martensiomyces pterosporus]